MSMWESVCVCVCVCGGWCVVAKKDRKRSRVAREGRKKRETFCFTHCC